MKRAEEKLGPGKKLYMAIQRGINKNHEL